MKGIVSFFVRQHMFVNLFTIFVIGYGISTLIRPFTGVVSAAWQIVFVRMMDRVGKGIRTAPRDALIASSVADQIRGKAYGFHRAMDHAGAVIGPLLSISVLTLLILLFRMRDTILILRWTFLLTIIPGMLAVLALIFFVQEKTDSDFSTKRKIFSLKQFDKNYMIYLGIIVLFTLGNSSDAFLLLRVQEALHHSQSLYAFIYSAPLIGDMVSRFGDLEAQRGLIDILFIPLIWSFFHIIKVIFSTHLGMLSDKIGRKIVITIGWSIYAFVYLSFAFLDRIPDTLQVLVTFALFAIYSLYYAFSEGAEKAFVADVVKPQLRGSAFGLFNFAIGLAALPASVLFGVLYYEFGATAAFGFGAVMALISIMLFVTFVEEHSN